MDRAFCSVHFYLGGFMKVQEAIEKRRAYSILENTEITDEILDLLTKAAQLSPSCYNNQPWRILFIRSKERLAEFKQVLTKGNDWAFAASMIAVVFAKKEDDCVIHDRKYYLFDTGIAVGQMLLQATELGLVAHPIAGYSPQKIRKITNIPEDYKIIAMIIFGKHPQKAEEEARPPRKDFSEFRYLEDYKK